MKNKTKLAMLGKHPEQQFGALNAPVYHASTILYSKLDDVLNRKSIFETQQQVTYGRRGTPTTFALEEVLTEIEQGYGTTLTSSGMQAIALSLISFLKAGDHILVVDCIYQPARCLARDFLARFGVSVTMFNPLIGKGIKDLIQKNTRAIYLEAPGSETFEVPDIPQIVEVAKEHNLLTIMDNTWATPLYFQPIRLGIDISVESLTKYISGHSDVTAGSITVGTSELLKQIKYSVEYFGTHLAPDDTFLTTRGIRTLAARLDTHMKSALILSEWLEQQSDVTRVLYPALPSHPGYQTWKRDFQGATGVFSLVLKPRPKENLAHMLDNMKIFKMGFSWGGVNSLIIPSKPERITKALYEGYLVRLSIGLEDVDDLKKDLEEGFKRYTHGPSST